MNPHLRTTPARVTHRRSSHTRARLTRVPVLAIVLALAAACSERPTAPADPLAALIAGAPPIEVVRDPDIFCPFGCDAIAAGDSMQHMVRFTDPTGRDHFREHAQWSSADERIATVSSSGMVVGRAPGEVEIRASVGPQAARLLVTIGTAHIEKVVLTAPTTQLDPRRSVQLTATAIDVLGNPAPDAPLYWFAATPSVVTVDERGLATAMGPGDGIVMVFAEFGRSAWISLHVTGTSAAPALAAGSVDVGGTQTCAVGATSTGFCWGWNYYGQLGDGTQGGDFETFPSPREVVGGLPFAQISAGDFHTCGLTGDGAAWCWGNGWSGQLGDGSFGGGSPRPTRVAAKQPFATIAAGGDHSCAIDARGVASCWGYGGEGQLGTGTPDDAAAPAPVAGGLAFARVFAGLWHSCAMAAEGTAYCWGGNEFGQLGNGKIGYASRSLVPVKVSTRHRFTAMDSRVSHACGVTAAGEAYCWGRNDVGQLGDGSHESRARPVRVESAVPFVAVATGAHHTCALTGAGEAYCWGNNEWGQLGDNGLTSRATPAPVHGAPRFRALTAGNNVTCGTTDAGEAWCWGSSHFGMLGNGQSGWDTISPVPVRVIAKGR